MDKWKGQRSSCSVAKLPISKTFLMRTIIVMMMMMAIVMMMMAKVITMVAIVMMMTMIVMMMLVIVMMFTFLLQYIEGGGCPLARHSRRTLDPLRTVMLPFRGCRLWIFGGTENCMMMMRTFMIVMMVMAKGKS